MSKLTARSTPNRDLREVVNTLKTKIAQGGSAFVSADDTKNVLSLESLTPGQLENSAYKHNELVTVVKEAFKAQGFGIEDIKAFTPQQWEAGAIALAACGNPLAYAHKAMTMENLSALANENTQIIDHGMESGFDYRAEHKIALEAFDDRNLVDNLAFNVMFNVAAARQDEFGEAFFPTTVVTPDQSGVAVSVRKIQVYNEVRHSLSGKPTDFNMMNLLDAVVDASILANTSTDAVPYYVTGNAENNANFCAVVTPHDVTVNGATFKTAPLLPNIDIGLLGLAQNPGVTPAGQFDSFDALDHRITLNQLYISVTSTAAAVTSIIPVVTESLPRTQYHKSNEGQEREMQLNFITTDIPLTGLTKNTANVAAPALVYLADPLRADWIVRLKISVSGRANLQYGTVSATPALVVIDSAWVAHGDGTFDPVTPAELTALKAELVSMTVVGYDLGAKRSNTNRRTLGLLVNSIEQNEIHSIPLGAPITANNPATQTKTNTDITAPITAARIRNSNNAVSKLLQYAAQLSALKVSYDRKTPVPSIQGIARHVLRPFYEHSAFDAVNTVNSIKSQDRALDLSAAMINRLREMIYRMYRDSGYQIALDAHTGHTGERPIVLIGTDPVIQRHLIIPGDTRLASIGFEHQVVTTMDQRMYGKIFVTLTRANQKGVDPLSFGFMAWMPELATSLQITRNNSTTIESMVQPRSVHVNTLPLLLEIDVTNLEEAIGDRVSIPFKTVP